MALTKQDVERVARLASLGLSAGEEARLAAELSKILQFVEKLNELDTEGVEPMSHAIPVYNVFRGDEPHDSLDTEEVLKNAPEREDGFFKVPKLLEG
ncbi:MAG: Asp-tRNA(Asn)/Glu-tRNA(Gln) amidotransferase subunit GatC [Bacillota bacterium]